jgi:hypothetical protein
MVGCHGGLMKSPKRLTCSIFCAALVLAGVPVASSSALAADPDDELKSAIVLSFLRYSTWRQLPAEGEPLTVGVVGRPSMNQALRRLFEGKSVNNHSLRAEEIKGTVDPHCCQVIYFATAMNEVKHGLLDLQNAQALTIGESDKFLEYGGAVILLPVEGHMGFEVSLEAVQRSAVEISSKLLRFGQVRKAR